MSILEDKRCSNLIGGYKTIYDPRPALRALALQYGNKSIWDELWNELHHQGDVGDASYAAVVEIAHISEGHAPAYWGAYGLAATIEEARLVDGRNPPIPDWIEPHTKLPGRLFSSWLCGIWQFRRMTRPLTAHWLLSPFIEAGSTSAEWRCARRMNARKCCGITSAASVQLYSPSNSRRAIRL
ncbi:hypothetical protein [Mesorhizobium sp. M1163]|uniref:hypothetical protein n=1 Tax=Mesorhizobium sp. M1163 TaxID=2957065 RepID=UPI00333CF19C